MYMQSQHCKLESQACRDCPFRCPFRCSSSSRGSHDGPSAAPTIASVCWFDLSLNPTLTILTIWYDMILYDMILYYIIYIVYNIHPYTRMYWTYYVCTSLASVARKHNEDLSLEIQGCQQVLDPGGNEVTCGYTSFNDHIYMYI